MSFYKKDNDDLLSAPNSVTGPNFELLSENKDTYTYPVDGWYWFDTLDAAMAGIPKNITPATTVSMRQARLALLQAGLLSQVNEYIAAMPGSTGDAARIEWEYAVDVPRNGTLLMALAPILGFTDPQIDSLFVLADTL